MTVKIIIDAPNDWFVTLQGHSHLYATNVENTTELGSILGILGGCGFAYGLASKLWDKYGNAEHVGKSLSVDLPGDGTFEVTELD